jgi:hypothetical protein
VRVEGRGRPTNSLREFFRGWGDTVTCFSIENHFVYTVF